MIGIEGGGERRRRSEGRDCGGLQGGERGTTRGDEVLQILLLLNPHEQGSYL